MKIEIHTIKQIDNSNGCRLKVESVERGTRLELI